MELVIEVDRIEETPQGVVLRLPKQTVYLYPRGTAGKPRPHAKRFVERDGRWVGQLDGEKGLHEGR